MKVAALRELPMDEADLAGLVELARESGNPKLAVIFEAPGDGAEAALKCAELYHDFALEARARFGNWGRTWSGLFVVEGEEWGA